MPLTPTPRLGLYKPDGPDPFERTKFNETWDKLDLAPGVHICTFNTRPATWGSGQAGRLVYETDTTRLLAWTGSNWQDPQAVPKVYAASGAPMTKHNNNTTSDATILSFTAIRPSQVAGFIITTTFVDGSGEVSWQYQPVFDGVSASMSSNANGRYPKAITTGYFHTNVAPFVRSASIGAHNLVLRTIVFGGSNPITTYDWKVVCWLSQQ